MDTPIPRPVEAHQTPATGPQEESQPTIGTGQEGAQNVLQRPETSPPGVSPVCGVQVAFWNPHEGGSEFPPPAMRGFLFEDLIHCLLSEAEAVTWGVAQELEEDGDLDKANALHAAMRLIRMAKGLANIAC